MSPPQPLDIPATNDLFGALDALFAAAPDEPIGFRNEAAVALAAPLPPEEDTVEIDHRGRRVLVSLPLEPDAALEQVERLFAEAEHYLGLAGGSTRAPVAPALPSPDQIGRWISLLHDEEMPLPDRADPLLERLAMRITASAVRFGRPLVPHWPARLELLVEHAEQLRTLSDPLIRRTVDAYVREPLRLLGEGVAADTPEEWRRVDAEIEEWIDHGMTRMAGPIGHWDRSGAWPAGLQLVQAAALACRAMLGDRAVWTEYSLIRRQLNRPSYAFLRAHFAVLDALRFPETVIASEADASATGARRRASVPRPGAEPAPPATPRAAAPPRPARDPSDPALAST